MRRKVSIIIPAWNEANILKKSFYFLKKLNLPFSYSELIIVAGGSDKTLEICQSVEFHNFQRIKILEQTSGDYKSGALIKGLKESKGDYITIMDADTLISSNFMKKIIKKLEEYDAVNANYFPILKKGFWYDYYIIRKKIWAKNPNNLPSLFGAATISLNRNIIEQIGIENLFTKITRAGVDHYMGLVLRENNIKIAFAQDAYVLTPRPGSLKDFYKDNNRWFSAFFRLHSDKNKLIKKTLILSLLGIIIPPSILLINLLKTKKSNEVSFNLREHIILFLAEYILNFIRLKNLVLVQTRKIKRIGHFKGFRY